MKHVLFICSQNRWRSPTAEQLFCRHPGIECASGGLARGAENPVTPELVAWADLIFVMEKVHRSRLQSGFRRHLRGQRIICLDIPDKYQYMDPALVQLLLAKVSPHLPAAVIDPA